METDPVFDGKRYKLVFFGGKGGVGKTTCAATCSLAMARSRPESSFLLVSTDPAHSLEDSFDGFPAPENLEIRELDASRCLERFKSENREKLRLIASRGTFFDDVDIERVLELSLPGLDELMGFLEISDWVLSGEYETVVVDTAPTGHALRLLEMPRLIGDWLNALDVLLAKHRYMKTLFQGAYEKDAVDDFLQGLSDSVKQVEKLLTDDERCRFVPVLLAEPLSLLETHDLLERLKTAGMPVSAVIVNRLLPENDCSICADAGRRQMRELSKFSKDLSGFDIWGVPLFADEVKGEILLDFFAAAFRVSPGGRDAAKKRETVVLEPLIENPAPFPDENLRLIIFAGKGGVGKTTLACSTAVGAAKELEDRKIFLFSTDPAHSLSHCLEKRIGPRPKKLAPRLWAMEIDAREEFDKLKRAYAEELESFLSGLSSSLDLTFDQQVMERLMDLAPPGLDEVMALNMAMEHMAGGRYDLLILDSAPTGHLIRLLETPEVMDQWLKVVFDLLLKYKTLFRLPELSRKLVQMSKDLKILKEVLSNPEKSALYAVSILTRMAFEETRDLVEACRSMGIEVPALFLNMATRNGPCPLCASVYRRESRIRKQFEGAFASLHRPVIYNQPGLRGMKKLGDLASYMYDEAKIRRTKP